MANPGNPLTPVQTAKAKTDDDRRPPAGAMAGPGRTLALLTALFLLWGFCSGLGDILNRHFQDTLHLSQAQAGLVQSANYIAYFLMALPAGWLARKFGYPGGILTGLGLLAGGSLWFIPATRIGTYGAYLAGVFIIASGMTVLETIANPYATLLGAREGGAARLNLAQTFNGLGRMLGPMVGGRFIFSGGGPGDPGSRLYIPYLGAGLAAAGLMAVFARARLPDPRAGEAARGAAAGRGRKPLWRRHHFTLGVAAQFCYLAAQTGVFSCFVNYALENDPGTTARQAATRLGVVGFGWFLLGRVGGGAVLRRAPAHGVLAVCAAISAGLMAVVTGGGRAGGMALCGAFFFMSVMFPTLFALGIRGLGEHTKAGSALMVMAMVGGALAPLGMGRIADVYTVRAAFAVPLAGFVFIALYGAAWPALAARDRAE
jgi:FHS family L-fucose permease-like MFS transporter